MQVTTVATGGAIASNFSRLQPPMSAITQRRAKPNPTATLRSGPIAPGACTADHGYSVLLHNMSATAVTGRAVLKEYSNGIGMAVGLLPISIAPGDTLLAEFRPPQSTTPESWHAVDVEYVGSAGNLVGMALAHRQAGVEVQPVSASASKHYVGTRWESALGASTGIRVVNAGRTPAEYAITFYAPDSSVLYRIKAPTLNPGQDALVDIGQLRDQAVPDTEGRQMPLTLEEGTFEVETADGNMDGLVFAAATNVSSDSTVTATPLGGFCCGSSSAGIQPNPVLVEWLTWNYAAWYRRDECTAVTRKASALSWWTDDAWIAEVDSIGGVHGLRAGTTNVDAEVELWLGGPFGCGDHWYETVYAPVYSYTPVQHNYPGNPLGQACRISQFFDRIGHSGSSHHAEDVVFDGVATSWGAPVYAMEAGTVTKVVATAGPASLPFPQCQGAGAPGNRVNVQAADGYITVYYHVMPLTGITVNTHVSQGQQIGNLDNSGCQSGPHLHVGRIDTASNPVNFTIPCVNPLPTNGFGDGSVDDDDVDIP